MKKILVVFGTRPEAIKLAPVIHYLRKKEMINLITCSTGQHSTMLKQVLKIFNIEVDYDFKVMKSNQSLYQISSKILNSFEKLLDNEMPDLVLVHGDTTTTFIASLASFYLKIPVAHIEAGLRTGNPLSPWPEEMNRLLTSKIATRHYAPTKIAKDNLVSEGVKKNHILVTGNTVIDALLFSKDLIQRDKNLKNKLDKKFSFIDKKKKILLVTGHRRENFGDGIKNICLALKEIAMSNKNELQIIFSVHLNPNVASPVNKILKGIDNIKLLPPQDYLAFIYLMEISNIILTDSGGIQEEAPSLKKPVIVMREFTERLEGVKNGNIILTGSDKSQIINSVNKLLNNQRFYNQMIEKANPYGDGNSAKLIVDDIINNLF